MVRECEPDSADSRSVDFDLILDQSTGLEGESLHDPDASICDSSICNGAWPVYN